MKVLPGVAALLAAIVLVWWALLFFGQRSLLFPAPSLAGAAPPPADAEVVRLALPYGPVEAWYLPPLTRNTVPAPLLIFAHGNGELVNYWPQEFSTPRRWGMGVLLVEYPGYGLSAGRPGEASITAAMLAAFDWAAARPDIDAARVVAYGRSLGGGAASALAARRPVAALVLESAFTSVGAFARRFGAPAFLVRDRFDNADVARSLRVPLLILHGEHDTVIPVAHAHALHAAQPASEIVVTPRGHNDMPRLWPTIESFLRRHRVLPDGGGGTLGG